MEPLSGVSSVLAVVSLAIQIADSVKKLSSFFESVQGAPESVRCLIQDLRLLSEVLEEISQGVNVNGTPHQLGINTLKRCLKTIHGLHQLLDELVPKFSSEKRVVRTWAALKAVLRDDKVRKIQGTLTDLKTTLLLVGQVSTSRALISYHEFNQSKLSKIADGMKVLLDGAPSRTVIFTTSNPTDQNEFETQLHDLKLEVKKTASTISNPMTRFAFENSMDSALLQIAKNIGSARFQQYPGCISAELSPHDNRDDCSINFSFEASQSITVYQCRLPCLLGVVNIHAGINKTSTSVLSTYSRTSDNIKDEIHISLIFHPSTWVQAIGIHYGMKMMISSSFRGLECGMSTYRAVPDDAVIFDFCKEGNTSAVQNLFDKRLASPWDTNSRGLTPLFLAAQYGNPETCKLLLSQGADPKARTFKNDSVAAYACLKVPMDSPKKPCRQYIDTQRMFIEHLEFDDEINCTGLTGFRRLYAKKCNHQLCSHAPNYPAGFHWLLPSLRQHVSVDVPSMGRAISQLCRQAMEDGDHEGLSRILDLAGDINAMNVTRWFSPAHFISTRILTSSCWESARILITKGLNLHHMPLDYHCQASRCRLVGVATATCFAMQNSFIFYQYRDLLRRSGIDIPTFIRDELVQGPLSQSGWTDITLQILFSLDYEPVRLELITCLICNKWNQYPAERSWRIFLERLIVYDATLTSLDEILSFQKSEVTNYQVDCSICTFCDEVSRRQGRDG